MNTSPRKAAAIETETVAANQQDDEQSLGDTFKFRSLTAHAADPDSNLIITLATEGLFQKFRCRLKALVETVLLIMVLGSNSEN